jgi:hypothetical protein
MSTAVAKIPAPSGYVCPAIDTAPASVRLGTAGLPVAESRSN